MHSDSIHAVSEVNQLRDRHTKLAIRMAEVRSLRDKATSDLASAKAEVASLSEDIQTLQKVLELYRTLVDKLVMSQIESIETLVSEGLSSIFQDQNIGFELEVSQKYNKVSIDPQLVHDGIKGDPLESFGGGPASIISLILRVFVLLRMKRFRALFLDETLVAVSDDYVENTALFLRKLAESSGLPVLLITHKAGFTDRSTIAYQAERNSNGEFVAKRLGK